MDLPRVPDPHESLEAAQRFIHEDLVVFTPRGLQAEQWRAQGALAGLVGQEPTARWEHAWEWWWSRLEAVDAALNLLATRPRLRV